jgi:hypothetical protein
MLEGECHEEIRCAAVELCSVDNSGGTDIRAKAKEI